jgi:hypothetical protein
MTQINLCIMLTLSYAFYFKGLVFQPEKVKNKRKKT